ncbi:MAG TPA: aminoacyl-tRNA hydrolase [Usitatibacter sp.]|jgi:PTH1 family peptidyl-tRNA hydrolase|nr:aminoacyl-tRNA hydrolase [Usitatibacter sp.]
MENPIRLIVGLGNPGPKYEKTRHNAGFRWVDAIAEAKRASWAREAKFSGWVARVEEGGRDFWLLKPGTYMNESGRSVSPFMRFYRIEPAELLVVHDELDIPPGSVKLKRGGGTGGHNGLEDVAAALDTKDFWRLRIGIGHPGNKDLVADYVLDRARKAEEELIEPAFERSLELFPRLASGRVQDALTWLHTSPEAEAKRREALEARKAQELKEPKQ